MVYNCSLCGYFESSKLCKIVSHISQNHSLDPNFYISCGLDDCPQSFRNFASFKSHLYRKHREHFFIDLGTESNKFQCPICNIDIESHKQAVQHLKVHITKQNGVQCPYNACNSIQYLHSSLRAHVSRHHKNEVVLREAWIVNNDIPDCFGEVEVDEENEGCGVTQSSSEKYIDSLALLLLKLEVVNLVPASTVQVILSGLLELFQLSNTLTIDSLRNFFQGNEIENGVLENVCQTVEQGVFAEAYEQLKSDYRRKEYYKHKFKFVNPVAFNLNRNENNELNSFYYIPLLETIKNVLEVDENFSKMLSPPDTGSMFLSGFSDGYLFKKLQFAEPWIRIILYYDDFEVVNPIGAHRGKHKIAGIYFTIDNLGVHSNSKTDSVFLLLLCRSKDFTHENLPEILSPLIEDLSSLENEGIDVNNHRLKGSLVFVAGDNLGSHFLGGFYESFGPYIQRPCRFCLCRNENMQGQFDSSKFISRTKENYTRHISLIEEDPSLQNTYGLKSDTPLNMLPSFHIIDGLPADCMHDVLEGVVPYELGLILTSLTKERYVTTDFVNRRICSFRYSHLDMRNKPVGISVSGSTVSVKQNAARNWCLIRLLPLMIGRFIPEGNLHWELLLNLKQCVDLIFCPEISHEAVVGLSHLLQENLQLFKHLFPHSRIKPKQHFMLHYPEQILKFGPLRSTWTMRFEAKHSYMKRVLQSTKNFKNPCKTLAVKHEFKRTCLAIGVAENPFGFDIPKCNLVEITDFPELVVNQLHTLGIISPTVYCCNYVSINCITYKVGMYIIIDFADEEPVFGCISDLIVHQNGIFFLSKKQKSFFCQHLSAYSVEPTESTVVTSQRNILSFYPLSGYYVYEKSYVVLKYHVAECE
ncbi:uncharacterized protein LOC117101675 [Anneissia japonica]|uniref:uncharacterized protein LOC117101675 n=1 Tax=Anneissia japonica TaxID=1529436 RepID=UPI0014257459|nr:uncharacterized protein LOC117101675 [Anneissia japonica]